MPTEVALLHLSDLHYEEKAAFQDDAKIELPPQLRTSAFRNLNHLLKNSFRQARPTAVVVSGDITTQGKPAGYTKFLNECAPLLTSLVKQPQAICMVPGNHDVTWNLDTTLPDYFDQKFKDYRDCVRTLGATSALIPTRGLTDPSQPEIEFGNTVPGPIYVDDVNSLLLICLNSSMRCGEANAAIRDKLRQPVVEALAALDKLDKALPLVTARHWLETLLPVIDAQSLFDVPHVTQAQLNVLRDALIARRDELKDRWQSFVKVAVLHHHVVPFDYQRAEYKPFEVLQDAAAVLETLAAFGVQIVLTGHKHQPYVQRAQHSNADMLIIGGATVGGYPIAGFGQAIRHIAIAQDNGQATVSVADLPCDWQGDIVTHTNRQIANAARYTLDSAQYIRRVHMPRQIETALAEQLYGRPFYKTDVSFEVDVEQGSQGELIFVTTTSYVVVNRTDTHQTWPAEYEYDVDTGKVLECQVNGADFDTNQRQFQTMRGLLVQIPLGPQERAGFRLKTRERFPDYGTVMYSSYNPATDLKLVFRSSLPDFEFDPVVLYFWKVWPVKNKGFLEVVLDKGLLPYQGVRINFRRKEHSTS